MQIEIFNVADNMEGKTEFAGQNYRVHTPRLPSNLGVFQSLVLAQSYIFTSQNVQCGENTETVFILSNQCNKIQN